MSKYRLTQTKFFLLVCVAFSLQPIGASSLGASANNESVQKMEDDAMGSSQERLQVMDQVLIGICQTADRLQQRLDSITKKCEFDDEKLPDLIHKQSKEKERLCERVKQLEKENAEIEALLKDTKPGDSNIPDEVAKARARKKWLLEEIAKCPYPCDVKGNPEFVSVSENMQPVAFVLSGSRITPLNEEHFKIRGVCYQGKQYAIIEKVQDGQLVTEALNRGGCIDACVSEIDPANKYITLLICPDGVGSFERVVKKIKEKKDKNDKVKERNIICVWTPIDEPPWVVNPDVFGQSPTGITGF